MAVTVLNIMVAAALPAWSHLLQRYKEEELIFRGYLMNTIARILGHRKGRWVMACLINSILFGLGHTYQGISGVILLGIIGLLYALFYLGSGRNLWVPILIHGLYDTSAFLVIFFNLDLSSS